MFRIKKRLRDKRGKYLLFDDDKFIQGFKTKRKARKKKKILKRVNFIEAKIRGYTEKIFLDLTDEEFELYCKIFGKPYEEMIRDK